MKIYHYTKGLHLKSIFKDGFIATEQKRNLNTTAPFFTVEYLLTDTNEWVECEPSSIVFRDIPNGRGYAICISPYLEAA